MLKLKDKRIYLGDVAAQLARHFRNDPEIRKWCREYTEISEAKHERWLTKIEEDPSIKMFGIYINQLDIKDESMGKIAACIGTCGLTSIDRVNQNAEFSLYIAKNYQKMGYGKEALQTLIWHGFNDFNLHRIWGEVFEGNPALKIFKEIGFTIEGVLRKSYFREGKFIDSIRIGILRGEECLS